MSEKHTLKIRTSDIPVAWLNARCRNLISKYAVIAHRSDGTVLDLRDNAILSQLSKHSKQTTVSELHLIYRTIKEELRGIVSSPKLKTAVNIMAQKYIYLESNHVH